MKPKQIENEYYEKLCEVFERYHSGAVEKCSATMKETSYDSKGKIYVYDYDGYDMTILKLDDFSELLAEKRKNQGHKKRTLPAADAICIDSKNNWYLIEFKNSEFSKRTVGSVQEKIFNSLWILFYTYSVTGEISYIIKDIHNNDIIQFAREHITYIVVCSEDKNTNIKNAIHMKEAMHIHYTPLALDPYINFCFKDAYLYTKQELKKIIASFE